MKTKNGYIAIITVLIISAVVLATAGTVSLLAIGEAQSSYSLFKGEDTLTFVEGCTEDALYKLRANSSYAGGNITRPEGTCTVAVSQISTTYTLTVSTTNTTYQRTIQIVCNRNPTGITLTSWKEI